MNEASDPHHPASPPERGPLPSGTPTTVREAALWRRLPWLLGGGLSLLLGVIGIFLPLLPTTPFVLLAAFCFARGSVRYEAWLVAHPRFGPMIRQWRTSRAVPLRAKQAAWTMMAISSIISALIMPRLPWLPALCCAAVGLWLWRLPTAASANEVTVHTDAPPSQASPLSLSTSASASASASTLASAAEATASTSPVVPPVADDRLPR